MSYTDVVVKIMARMAERSELIDQFLGAMLDQIPGGMKTLREYMEKHDEDIKEALIAIIQVIKEESPELLSIPGEDIGKEESN